MKTRGLRHVSSPGLTLLLLCLGQAGTLASRASADDALFRGKVAPILQRRCLSCHNSEEKKGGLILETAESLATGGDSGSPIAPGEPDESYLLDLITPDLGKAKMPKNADPLKADEIAAVRAWIGAGAAWPKDFKLEPARVASTDWWSLRPLVRPPVPSLEGEDAAWARTPVDAFIAAKHKERGLTHSPEADRRTLIRRLYFDLIGLPPTPEEIKAFVSDPDEQAYEKLVDRLLASPHYGERWARHWLDVVHYGETHGYDKDKPRLHAWPYRDYVIRSLNDDKPYDRFVQEQIAGDVLYPGTQDGMEALGFIAAGPWDFIGHAEVPETKIDGKVARHLDRDDMVTNTIQTFNSLTIQCAQCHNHKFDPILQEDYYRLQAVFAAVDRTERPYDVEPDVAKSRAELLAREASLKSQRATIDKRIAERGGERLKEIDAAIAKAKAVSTPGSAYPPEFGYHSGISDKQEVTKWVQIDLKRPMTLSKIILRPCHDDFNGIGDGFGFPLRYKVELLVEEEAGKREKGNGKREESKEKTEIRETITNPPSAVVLLDRTSEDVSNPKLTPLTIEVESKAGRYVRITATKLAPRLATDYIFAIAELEVYDAKGKNVATEAEVTALDSIEAPVRWQRKNLVDGLYPAKGTTTEELATLQKQRDELIDASTSESDRRALAELGRVSAELSQAIAALPAQQMVYVGAVHTGSGTFEGTGKNGGKPRPVFVLNRGNVTQPGKKVAPGPLSTLGFLPGDFNLPESHTEGERRAALAHWLSHKSNPLMWRSVVNRVWQYHFGRGIVDSPNDFGRNGRLPTHPELLDWLAVEFRDGGHSLKKLHRLMVLSATYRQESGRDQAPGDRELGGSKEEVRSQKAEGGSKKVKEGTEQEDVLNQQSAIPNQQSPSALDSENSYLWRMNRRKLEAELVRDNVLVLAGKVDRKLYGPSFQDFVIDKPEHSPHYKYQAHDPDDPRSHRRSIYRFLVRSQPQPLMAALDCADPSMQVDKRNESLSALQALALLNNGFMVTMSQHFAERIEKSPGELPDKVARAYAEAVGREPSAAELSALVDFAQQHGLANLCRVLLNLNEFVFVD